MGGETPLNRIRSSGAVDTINAFLRTPGYVVLIALLTAVSNAFSLDLYLYTVFILIGIYMSLFGEDYLPLMPIVIHCYIAPSTQNNPGRNPDSIFYPMNGGIYLMILLALFVISVVVRLVKDRRIGGKHFLKEKRSLTVGMLLLGAGYLLSGLGMESYSQVAPKNLLFAFIQFASVFVFYFFFTGAVKWEKVRKDYLAWTGLCVGFVVLIQLLENYLSGRIFMDGSGTIDRELINTGWGMHNNIGGLMAMMLPFAFYLAYTKPHGWIYNILGTVLLLGVIISCSRTAMLVAMAAYILCAVILLRNKDRRKTNLRVYVFAAIGVLAAVIVFFDELLDVFALFFDELFIVSQRNNLFYYGMKQFLEYPIFGGTFFPQGEYVPWDWSELESFTSFFPPRWHNTLVQIAASCGIVGLAAYGFHRYQTVKLLVRDRSEEKLFILIYVGVLLVCSLLDCHFFNVGPVLFYSMALAFAEKIEKSKL